MTNKEIFELIRKSKVMKSKVPATVILAGKHKAENFGELHHFAKLTNAEVYQMRLSHEKYGSRVCDLARQYNVNYHTAWKICKYRDRIANG